MTDASLRFIAQILNERSLREVVAAHVEVRAIGKRQAACCPFHPDKGASLTVDEDKQLFSCHGCGACGNAIDFLARYHRVSFEEAARDLGGHLGIEGEIAPLPVPDPADDLAPQTRRLVQVQREAADFYSRALSGSVHAGEYLAQRGLTDAIIREMGLGYAPGGWQSLKSGIASLDEQAAQDAGLLVQNESAQRYDRFRDRIMFPIRNQAGLVIGFGGRIINAGEPKYLNSPETAVFSKGRELYGLYEAKEGIRAAGFALVTEGYMDVVALRQLGWSNAVATLGTATSDAHIDRLLGYTRQIVYSFDGDRAGRKAAWRALESALPYLQDDFGFRFLFLPADHDPDSFIRSQGSDAFRVLVQGAAQPYEVVLSEMAARHDLAALEGRANMLEDVAAMLRQMPIGQQRRLLTIGAAERAQVGAADLAALSGISYATISGDIETPSSSPSSGTS